MRLRHIRYLIGVLTYLISSLAFSLGLGEITLNSQYNEPLDAEIRLLKVGDLTEREILVSLASREDFRRAGVERPFFLSNLRFDISLANPANPSIRVTSTQPVTEPYLNFLVDMQWPSGRLVREYTLLLDLPVFAEQAPAPVSQPSTSIAQPTPSQPVEPVRTAPARPAPVESTAPASVNRPAPTNTAGDQYRVRSGDTLWEIAARTRANESISVNQQMVAIQELNPSAFINGNINLLKNGRVLRVPDASQARQNSALQADQIVQSQTQSWRNQNRQQPVLTASQPSSRNTNSSQPEGRLTLGSADGGADQVSGSGTSGQGQALQNELAINQEALDKANRENSELRSRINDLENQIQTMEELINISNDQLKALETALSTDGDTNTSSTNTDTVAADPSNTAVDDELLVERTVIEPQPVEPIATETPDGSIDSVQDTSPIDIPAPVEPLPIPEPIPVEPVTASSPSIIDIIKDNLIAIGGGLLALLLLILLLLRLREKPEETDDSLDELDLSDDDEFAEDSVFDEDLDIPDDDDDVESFEENFDIAEEQETVEAQTEDVVAEADIYISLGQEDKAIDLLQGEIHQNPDNAEARLSLLKIYANNNDATSFDDQYAQLLPLGNVLANNQADALRQNIAGIGEFDTDSYAVDQEFESKIDETLDDAVDSIDESLDLDLDLDLDLEDASDSVSGLDSENLENLEDLDLDLDLDTDTSLDFSDTDLPDLDDDLDSLPSASDVDSIDVEDLVEEVDLEMGDMDVDSASALDLREVSELSLDKDESDALDLENSVILNSDSDESIDDLIPDLELDIIEGEDDESLVEIDIDVEELAEDDFSLDLDDDALSEVELPDALEIDLSEAEEAIDEGIQSSTDDLSLSDFEDISLEQENLKSEISPESLLDELSEDSLDELDISEDDSLSLDDESLELGSLELDSSADAIVEDTVEKVADAVDDSVESLDLGDVENALSLDDDPLDLDASIGDFDLDSLDREIDEMTADLEKEGGEQFEVPTLDTPETSLDDLTVDSEFESLDAIVDEPAEIEGESLASDELDEPEEISVESLDDVSISEDGDLSFLEETDEVATKLDLAKAYIDMGDKEGAQDILAEVMEEGSEAQKEQAQTLLGKL